jgi:hypothetical protein
VDRLLFPVKLGLEMQDVSQEFPPEHLGETPRRTTRFRGSLGILAGCLAGLAGTALGCGYEPVYGAGQPHYSVAAGRFSSASFEAVQSTLDGMRSELGAAQALGTGPAQVTVEISRVDERSLGVRSMGNASPLARGSEVVVVGRALVRDKPEAAARIDTGDMSRAAQYAAGGTPSADAAARSRAVRDASRSLGKALGRVVLGLPEPAEG